MSVALYLNNTEIPLTKGSYSESRSHYQITGETEAGTNRRDLIRANILGLSVTLIGTTATKTALESYNAEASLTVKHYSGSTLVTWTAYMDELSCELLTDGEWEISFELIDMEQ